MINVTLLSQRDRKWGEETHGTSTKKLRETGCTITCLTMLLDYFGYIETPSTVNRKLTQNNGYASGNLLVWGQVPIIWPGMVYNGRFKTYNDSQVKQYLTEGLPVMVEVDGAPIGAPGGKHWVLAIGDGRCVDPWTGKYSELSGWKLLGYALYKHPLVKQETPVKEDTLSKALTHFNVKNEDELISMVDQQLQFLSDARKENEQLKQYASDLEKQLNTDIKDYEQSLGECFTDLKALQIKSEGQELELRKLREAISVYEEAKRLETERKESLPAPTRPRTEVSIAEITMGDIVKDTIERIVLWIKKKFGYDK